MKKPLSERSGALRLDRFGIAEFRQADQADGEKEDASFPGKRHVDCCPGQHHASRGQLDFFK